MGFWKFILKNWGIQVLLLWAAVVSWTAWFSEGTDPLVSLVPASIITAAVAIGSWVYWNTRLK